MLEEKRRRTIWRSGGIRWLGMAFGTGKKLGDYAPHTCGCGCGCFFLSMTDSRRIKYDYIMFAHLLTDRGHVRAAEYA
ncbi:hypothetical protein KC335_g112 [Hortaea werneckii]|nr:hypothetical protein KC335_g112 [Hortaea werneckii]